MKILDRYLLKTFLITFTSVFVILFFIFILQTVWLFIAELAGKDLDLILIVKFLLYSMPTVIPLVLPLSILLASIMTFGDLSENYEFAAMKSSGVSLQRAMKSLIVFIFVLSIAAFAFANNVIPYAQYKFINFRKNIAQVKPAMAIAEGQFSDVGNYNIKVEKKSGENGNLLQGVTIHKKSLGGNSSNAVIKAKNGELLSSEDSNILQLVLFEGFQYEDVVPKKYEDRKKLPFTKTSFKKYIMNLDLSQLNKVDVDDEKVANTNTMLNINELRYTLDSLSTNYDNDLISFTENIHLRTGITNHQSQKKTIPPYRQALNKPIEPPISKTIIEKVDTTKATSTKDSTKAVIKNKIARNDNLLSTYNDNDKAKFLEIARNNTTNTISTVIGTKDELFNKQKTINEHWIAFHDKFVIAYACILMFFIGAPLGAIIRKGGLGLPIVFAVLIFITFHFINTFGKKIAQENEITPFLGAWMASMILTPLAILLTYRATNDIGLINLDVILAPFQKLFKKKKSQQK
ncbi:lipopolysaccharide export system permease protein [Flavobacterium arsenatis]|uniref:Lipopolysaccharide export system permease protein n=1 Tax=Flavobacterium arsenatis TaxID=1484332 RepID=A0ABU1TQB2_9FLAO|nr:LptF/LptG family permease [Flavobacterium arsenatis]MDR6968144.1 lipopolysaccharide export system permease protein [Flavobacterium arsenatis]